MKPLIPLEDRDYIIYLITNMINGKMYVGQTCKTLERRWEAHCWNAEKKTGNYFASAIDKHGSESFLVEKVCLAKGKTEANRLESFFIDWYETMDRTKGYNCTSGGDGGYAVSDESRQKMSVSQKALNRKMSPEQKELLSEIARTREITKEERLKRSRSLRKLPTEEVHRLYLEEGLNTYEISEKLGTTQSSIWNLLKFDEVERRPNKGATLPQYRDDLPWDEMTKLYTQENFSLVTLAEKYQVSPATVRRHLTEFGTPIRTRTEGVKESIKKSFFSKIVGDFEVISKTFIRLKDKRYWLCRCTKCGFKQLHTTNQLKSGKVSRCEEKWHKKIPNLLAYWPEPTPV